MPEVDERLMDLALDEGYKGKGRTSPNPAVGAVVAKNGEVISVGYHAKAGEAHAERIALELAGEKARGAILYVTLEPCDHYGKTPPCTEAIIAAGIADVIIGTLDPDPRNAGRGAAKLVQNGVEVMLGVKREECRELCEDFAKYVNTGIPFVTVKYAMTLDGNIATRGGDSFWVTSQDAREFVHIMRWEHNAVAVGKGTVASDDPGLTVRLEDRDEASGPIRLVVTTNGDISPDSRVIAGAPNPPAWIACAGQINEERRAAFENRGAEIIITREDRGRVSLKSLLHELGERGVMSLMVEGGARLIGGFVNEGLTDKVYAFIAPKLIGGAGINPISGDGCDKMAEALPLLKPRIRYFDNDFTVIGYLTDSDRFFPEGY